MFSSIGQLSGNWNKAEGRQFSQMRSMINVLQLITKPKHVFYYLLTAPRAFGPVGFNKLQPESLKSHKKLLPGLETKELG